MSANNKSAAPVSEPHPDALPDGTFSKSTMKRHAALKGDAASGEGLAQMHAALDRLERDSYMPNFAGSEDRKRDLALVHRLIEGCDVRKAFAEYDAADPNRRLPTTGQGDVERLVSELRHLYHAYVRLLETGRDRIVELGGTCDPVDAMERMDPYLIQTRRFLETFGQQQEGQR